MKKTTQGTWAAATLLLCSTVAAQARAMAESAEVTILSSNLASARVVGEWGFSALAEVDGHCVLFDAGRDPDTVRRNARAPDVDLSCVTDVVLSHFHFDHVGGLQVLLEDARSRNPDAFRHFHVVDDVFLPRRVRGSAAVVGRG